MKRYNGSDVLSSGKIISVFGSSRPREQDAAYEEVRLLGRELARRGLRVCSGGYGGAMEAVSRGAKEAGGHTIAITSSFFRTRANRWIDEEHAASTWQERLFELIRFGDGYVACAGGTGTLVELAVVWEMLNKRVMPARPFVVLGDFWKPVLDRVREVEADHSSRWAEANGPLIQIARTPGEAAEFLLRNLTGPKPEQEDGVALR